MSPESSESQRVAKAQRGDLREFEWLYRRYLPQVYGLCRRMLESTEEAEDMTQRVFLRAWQRISEFGGSGAFGGWLRRMAVNLMIDERRARWREDMVELPEEGLPAPTASVGERVDLERAVAALPTGARRVLVLHDMEGFTHEEIGELLGVTAGTTKTQLHRARKALRKVLA